MTNDQIKTVHNHARAIAEMAANTCLQEDGTINNQITLCSLMLATCIVGRFFDESPELMGRLLNAMLIAVEDIPPADEFDHPLKH